MANQGMTLIGKFRQAMAGLWQRLGSRPTVVQQGSGAVATDGGTAAGAGGVAVGGNMIGDILIGSSAPPSRVQGLYQAYLSWVLQEARHVPLTGVDPKSIREETRRDLDLAAVYTALMTQRPEATGERQVAVDREPRRLSAVAVLNAERHLALLGDPGSGKTTFVNFVALCLAGDRLGHSEAHLHALTTPVPDDAQTRRRDDATPPPQSWDHGPLLPIRVTLRDFVARGLPAPGSTARIGGETLWQFIVRELPEPMRDFAKPLRDELLQDGGLLLLDGLDEVPEAQQRRLQVKTVVEEFAALFPRLRVLVTSRTYAYQQQDWKLRGFAEAELAPFGAGQIERFVERWYAYVGPLRGLSTADAQGRAVLLNEAIRRSPRLQELAARPLLLTLMASLHAWRGGRLPEQREELYAEAVELLLDQWESQKLRRRQDGTYDLIEPSLAEWLRTDQKAIRHTLNRLAFEAHRDQPTLIGTADIAQEQLVTTLMAVNQNPDPDARPARLIEYLSHRAGLLEPRGVGIYAFPHRTFQEYLAACYLTDIGYPDEAADLLRAEPNRWREVVLLAGAKAARGTAAAAWTLAEALCFAEPPAQPPADEGGYWGALLAAQVLLENRSLEQVAERHRPKVERIRQWLTCTLRHGALPQIDRAQAGDALAVIGDPRFRADAWYLPDEPLLGFVEIPAGSFLMGSDATRDPEAEESEMPQHSLTLPGFFIGRYPVTVAQFRAFVEDSSYRLPDDDSLQGLPTHPVVCVTWYNALRYCDWLTGKLRQWSATPEPLATLVRQEGWHVTLPSEAEWEKAARGADGRIFPWGDTPNPNRANYGDTGINATNVVGCFPDGASPYGIQEMSGNVWEWTRSLWASKYPNAPNEGREDPAAPEQGVRVTRGGAFSYGRRDMRCVSRDYNDPHWRLTNVGFRVVVRPLAFDLWTLAPSELWGESRGDLPSGKPAENRDPNVVAMREEARWIPSHSQPVP